MTATQQVVHATVEVEETTQSKTIDELGKQAADKFVEQNGSPIAPKKTIKRRDWRLGTSKLTGDMVRNNISRNSTRDDSKRCSDCCIDYAANFA